MTLALPFWALEKDAADLGVGGVESSVEGFDETADVVGNEGGAGEVEGLGLKGLFLGVGDAVGVDDALNTTRNYVGLWRKDGTEHATIVAIFLEVSRKVDANRK